MRRRITRFLLGCLYVVLLAALLITHTRQIAGELERTMALVETLLLAVPAITILALYVRMEESEKNGNKSGEPEIVTLEQLKESSGFVLTEREWEIAWLIYRGYSNRQIAEECCIAETTVKKHTSHIYEKTQVSGRKELKEKFYSAQKQ